MVGREGIEPPTPGFSDPAGDDPQLHESARNPRACAALDVAPECAGVNSRRPRMDSAWPQSMAFRRAGAQTRRLCIVGGQDGSSDERPSTTRSYLTDGSTEP